MLQAVPSLEMCYVAPGQAGKKEEQNGGFTGLSLLETGFFQPSHPALSSHVLLGKHWTRQCPAEKKDGGEI